MHFLAVLGDKNMNVKINYILITVICTEGSSRLQLHACVIVFKGLYTNLFMCSKIYYFFFSIFMERCITKPTKFPG